MTAEHATIILHSALAGANVEHPVTKRVIAAIPPGKVDYRPDDIVKSAIDLAWHIVTAEIRFLNAVSSGAFDLTPMPRPESVRTADDVNRWYAEQFTKAVEKVTQTPGDQLAKTVDFRGILQFPAVAYVQIGINHTIHHRGQLSMYLRPMGAKVPSIYGESYDARIERESQMAKQA
jgi:uncharacterized damage-inducible protein DinB